ncbi:MAG: lysophospholipid acyltransferase family protein [Flavobacteriaceae bacterium]|jgi:KDO2-lipid IV(A) lauroyltransferase|nr:lipid A biosynthesis acyltransferase [Flavobacteriaceae bacterium]|tara:strand:+ start:1518 stop:2399 length:882 start_codon:yes stop_codon:yes gene_type:complete
MERLTFIITFPFLLLISWMPFGILYLLSDILYYLLYHVAGYRKNVVRKNIKLSGLVKTKKEALAIERKFYRYLCDLFLEMIKVKGMSKNDMMRRFKLTNPSILKDFARMNKSVFVMAGHYGNFEWLLSLGHHTPHTAHGIYAPLQNPYFDKYLKKVRSLHGSFLISRKKFREQFTNMQHRKELTVIGFAADQSPQDKKKNYFRNFFGHEVPVFTGAERLGKTFDVPILMAKVRRIKRGYYETTLNLLAENPRTLPDYAITDFFYEQLETLIKEDPSLYFWSHNRFKLMRQTQQ